MDGPPKIFDRTLLDRRRRRAARAAAPGVTFLLETVADDLAERLAAVERRFDLGAEIGSAGTVLAERLLATGRVARLIRLDRLAEAQPDLIGDEASLPFADASLDLAVSALALHAIDDLPGTFAQIRRALKPDGLFLAAFAGGDTLTELRQSLAAAEEELSGGAAPRVSPFVEVRALGQLLQRAGFALPVTDQDRLTIRYADMFGLMRDLRAMGATNVLILRERRPLLRAVLFRAAAIYAERFGDADGRVRATFDILSLSGWAPHASQQKALRPGSATVRLADALGASEKPAGEKAR